MSIKNFENTGFIEETIKLNSDDEKVKYIKKGDGSHIIFLHGFPDHPYTFEAQMNFFSDQGYSTVAPYMRGYYKEGYDSKKVISSIQLGIDLIDFIKALNLDRVSIVAHDWGCAAAYTAAIMEPSLFESISCIGIPYGNTVYNELCQTTEQQKQSWYYFMLNSSVAPASLSYNDFNLINVLWKDWTLNYTISEEELIEIKGIFKENYKYSVSYYQNAFKVNLSMKLVPYFKNLVNGKLSIPFLLIHGEKDNCILIETSKKSLSQSIFINTDFVEIKDAGHFPHREQPSQVNHEILNRINANIIV